tara:strand:+ start:195 stop:842 length:648 start_codon:yes stop_codon:yes gene_type:complete
MSFKTVARKKVLKSSKLPCKLVSMMPVNEIDAQGNAVKGASLTFKLESGTEYSVLFAVGQRNLNRKIERFLSPEFGKFGQERYAEPDWRSYVGTETPVPDEKGLTMSEMVVAALMHDASQSVDLNPSDMLVHRMFADFEVDEDNNYVLDKEGNPIRTSTDWATTYSCFIYVDDTGNELTPGFGHSEQPLKERNGNSTSARTSIRNQIAARRIAAK